MKFRFLPFLLAVFLAKALTAQPWLEPPSQSSNFFSIQAASESYFSEKSSDAPRGYKQFKRWEAYWAPRVYADGTFPAPDLAAREWATYVREKGSSLRSGGDSNWSSLGPNASPGGYHGIGRINRITFHPSDTNVLFACTAGGGLWKTRDSGKNWIPLTDQLQSLGTSGLVIDPNAPNTMYLATGDADSHDTYSFGVLKTTDGGQTWSPTGLYFSEYNWVIYALTMHPKNSNILIAATNSGIFQTTNGGVSWKKTSPNLTFFEIEHKPNTQGTFYAAGIDGIYLSSDSGASWTKVLNLANARRAALTVSPANPEFLGILVASEETYGFEGFYASFNGGASFELRSTYPNILSSEPDGSGADGQGWYDLCVVASPVNPNVIYAGGVNMWKSLDGGKSWRLLTNWYRLDGVPNIHADFHDLLFRDDRTLFVANDGGIYRTRDGGSSWTDLSNTLTISQIYRVSASQQDKKILTGLQDNGTKLYSDGQWTEETGGDGMECAIDPTNELVMYASTQHGGNFYRSANGGATWDKLLIDAGKGAWITPFELDPQNPSVLYVGYQSLYKSLNRGKTWSDISDYLTQGNLITLLALAPSNSNILFVGWINSAGRSQLAKSTDGGQQWASITLPEPVSTSYRLSSLTIDHTNPNIVYTAFAGYLKGSKVFRSTDGGQTWSNFSGSLPNLPANKILCQKSKNGLAYLAMDVGIFYRDNTMSDWELYSNNLPNVEIFDLDIRYSDGMLVAATYGRGLWQSPVPGNSLTYMDPNPRILDFSANGGVKTINVTSNTSWVAADTLSWITVNQTSGSTNGAISIQCQPNTGGQRSGVIAFTGVGATPVRVTINQESPPGYCEKPKNVRVGSEGYSFVNILWDEVNGATAYSWRYKSAGSTQWYQQDNWSKWSTNLILFRPPCGETVVQVRTVCSTGFSEWSPELKLKTTGCGELYCYSYSTQNAAIWVKKVQFAGINNSSSREYGYKNFTDIVGTVRTSFSYPITLASSDNGLASDTYLFWNVWIDFNQDNDFDDPDELVLSEAIDRESSLKGFTNQIMIPADAKSGKTRMRVNISNEYDDTPCSTIGDREVEDYTIQIKPGVICAPPQNVDTVSIGYNWLHAVWDTIPDDLAYNCRIQEVGESTWKYIGRDTGVTGLWLSGLKPCGYYLLQVQSVCPDPVDSVTLSDWSDILPVQLLGCDDPYCYSYGNATIWITKTELGDLSQKSGNDLGYANYTDRIAHVQIGKKYPVALASGSTTTLTNPVIYWSIWIDFNQDYDFDDTGENVLKKYTSRTVSQAGIFDEIRIPLNARSGKTRMRVSISVDYGDTPCDSRLIAREVEDYTLIIEQVTPFIAAIPNNIILPDKGGTVAVSVQSNVSWNIVENLAWLSMSPVAGNDTATVMISCQPNIASLRTGVFALTGPNGMDQTTVNVIQEGVKSNPPLGWQFKATPNRHAILIPKELISNIEGRPLVKGDQIGAFYQGRCIGYVAWTGELNYFLIYEDDPQTTVKEGPAPGERFTVKVWRESLRLELDAEAVFAPLGYAQVVNASDVFTPNGISAITEIRANRTETMEIDLRTGWNLISAFLLPAHSALDSVFSVSKSWVISVRDISGNIYSQSSLSSAATWDATKGYRIKASSNAMLRIKGKAVDPEQQVIPIVADWQYVPVFSRVPVPADQLFSVLGKSLVIAKDNHGRTYIPEFSINTIGSLIPGQAYHLLSKVNTTLHYPTTGMLLPVNSVNVEQIGIQSDSTKYFKLPSEYHTGVNATLVFPAHLLQTTLQVGDEVGAFTADGLLCGAARYNGTNLALTIWGDDVEQAGQQGYSPGEPYRIKAWRASDGYVYPLLLEFANSLGNYKDDDLAIVQKITQAPTSVIEPIPATAFRLYPNPSSGVFILEPEHDLRGPLVIRVTSASGQRIIEETIASWLPLTPRTLDLTNVAAGVYQVQVLGSDFTWSSLLFMNH